MKFLKVLFILLAFTACKKEDKPEKVPLGNLTGTVQNEFGQPIEAAQIDIPSHKGATSNALGEFTINYLPAKEYTISVFKDNYISSTISVLLVENTTQTVKFILKAGKTVLDLSNSAINALPRPGSFDLIITSNTSWAIKNSSSWVNCSDVSGGGTKSVSLKWDENNTLNDRIDTLTVIAGQLAKKVIITQNAYIKVVSYEALIGNQKKNIPDSVLVLFNKPVTIDFISASGSNLQCDMSYTLQSNNRELRFAYECAVLGGKYSFTIGVSDKDGTKQTLNVTVPFYSGKIKIPGTITDYFIDGSNSSCWIATNFPHQIININIIDTTLKRIFPLNFPPQRIHLNPYNNKLYALSGASNAFYDSFIYVMNIHNGKIEKEIILEDDQYDHPQHQQIYATDIGFASNGYGVVVLEAKGMSGSRWKIIDSSKGDTIYIHKDWNPLSGNRIDVESVNSSFDKTRLILTSPIGSTSGINILDAITQHIQMINNEVNMDLIPNKKSNKFYVMLREFKHSKQFIMDLTGNQIGPFTYIRYDISSADFSYRVGESNHIYHINDGFFRIVNYNNVNVPMMCDVDLGLKKFLSTTDGKYLLARDENNITVFKTEMLYRHVK